MGYFPTPSNLQQQASMCAWTEWDMPFDQLFIGECDFLTSWSFEVLSSE
jgi:hypothetical protein